MIRIASSITAAILALAGLLLVVFGNAWAMAMFEFLPDNEFGFWVELVVPFLPMAFIALGAVIYVNGRTSDQKN